MGKNEREAASVLSNAQRHTHFLDSPRIAAATAHSDFRFAGLRHERISVFLVLPPDLLNAYARWLRLLVAQALQEIARDAQGGSQALSEAPCDLPPRRVRRSRPPEAVERAMGLMAGYGLQLWSILQDLSQLRDLYGARAGTFSPMPPWCRHSA